MNLMSADVEWSMSTRKPYPSDVTEDEWALVGPYLTLLSEDAGQRKYDLREVFNALRYLVRTGVQWRMLPHEFPRWEAVAQQTDPGWFRAGSFEVIVHDLRSCSCGAGGPRRKPTAVTGRAHAAIDT